MLPHKYSLKHNSCAEVLTGLLSYKPLNQILMLIIYPYERFMLHYFTFGVLLFEMF